MGDILHCTPAFDSLRKVSVISVRRLIASLIGMALCSLALTGPARAVDRHAIAHLFTPVAAGEYHHHADDGTVQIDHDHDGSASQDRDGRGHEHMPGHIGANAVIETADMSFSVEWVIRERQALPVSGVPLPFAVPPDIRPPSFG